MSKTFLTSVQETLEQHPALSILEDNKGKDTPPTPVKKDLDALGLLLETKSLRLNLLIRPSLKEKLVLLSKQDNTSLNDLINRALEDYTKTRLNTEEQR